MVTKIHCYGLYTVFLFTIICLFKQNKHSLMITINLWIYRLNLCICYLHMICIFKRHRMEILGEWTKSEIHDIVCLSSLWWLPLIWARLFFSNSGCKTKFQMALMMSGFSDDLVRPSEIISFTPEWDGNMTYQGGGGGQCISSLIFLMSAYGCILFIIWNLPFICRNLSCVLLKQDNMTHKSSEMGKCEL